MNRYTPEDDENRLTVRPGADTGETLTAEIVVSGTRGAECTIYPAEAKGLDLMTRWITAEEGSFVNLDDVR